MKKFAVPAALFLLATSSLGGCTHPVIHEEVADRLANPAWMKERVIPAGRFALTVRERMHKRFAQADVYIEGDGKAWIGKHRASLDPTPVNPVALHLATRDLADNVVWMARPCQYTKLANKADGQCDAAYWTGKRFSPEVIDSYNQALDEIKRRYDIEGFNLVGFSGGGAVAAILAGQREDVHSLRTVAGNLDHKAHSAWHQVSPLTGSLNPPDFAGRLAAIPQVHFIGGQDEIVPPAVFNSYVQALGSTNCVQAKFVQEAAHDTGWVDKWPDLLAIAPECHGEVAPYVIEEPPLAPIIAREKPDKP